MSKKCSNVIEGINQDIPRYKSDDPNYNDDHPTQKPVSLMKHLLLIHSKKGDIVLDSFMGNGSTGIACKELGRKFIGIEIEPKYFNIAKQRIQNTVELMF